MSNLNWSMDDRTEPNNCYGTNGYSGTRFCYDIICTLYEVIWFGPWFVILVRNFGTILIGSIRSTKFLVRNSVVRFMFGLLVRDFRTGTEWFGSFRIFQKIVFFEPNRLRTELFTNRFIWYEIGSVWTLGKNIFIFLYQLRTGQITYQISWFVIGSVQKINFLKNTIQSKYLEKYFQNFRNFEFSKSQILNQF